MSKVLTFSTRFPAKHPKAGEKTFFVEKMMACFADIVPDWRMLDSFVQYEWLEYYNCTQVKSHTIRAGKRWKVGDKFSPRIWSGKPYCTKQIIFSEDIEIKKIWNVDIFWDGDRLEVLIPQPDFIYLMLPLGELSKNDGLSLDDFVDWFFIPKSKKKKVEAQIICWNKNINY